MDNPIFDMNTFISEFSPSSSIVEDIEILCQGMEKMFAGQPAEMTIFSHRLARVLEWAKIRTPAEGSTTTAGWRARYAGLPGLGGTLTCLNDEQEWMLSMDSSNEAYLGSWRSLRPGEEECGGLFSIENSPSGKVLVLDTGQAKQQIPLPGSEGLTWGSIAGFLQGAQNEGASQSDAAERKLIQPPPPPQPDILAAKLPPSESPTFLSMPAVSPKPPVLPLPHISGNDLSPSEQPGIENLKEWQCACGSKNAGQFCPKCGSEKPASVAIQNSVPAQPSVCKQCGGVLSIGARFCRNCGAEARG